MAIGMDLESNKYLVGVYDASGDIPCLLSDYIGIDKLLVYSISLLSRFKKYNVLIEFLKEMGHLDCQKVGEENYHLIAKKLFFSGCQNIVLKVDSVEAMSLMTGAIIALMEGEINSLFIISDINFNSLCEMGFEDESILLFRFREEGRFNLESNFSLDKFLRPLKKRDMEA